MKRFNATILLLAASAASQGVFASCGSAFCTLNTGAEAVGVWDRPGTRVELRYEYIDQNQLRSGTNKVEPAREPGDHDENFTKNHNWLLSIDHSFDANWGVSLNVPYVDRQHEHVDNHLETEVHEDGDVHTHLHSALEEWNIDGLGDLRLVGRYQLTRETETSGAYGLRFGLKLPTGKTDARNGEGIPAERTLQPGTGTTDWILGAYYRGPGFRGSEWFLSVAAQNAINSYDDFRPGFRVGFDLGLNVPLGSVVTGVVQLNGLHKGNDSGAQAEPEDSGGDYLFISPGLSLALSQPLSVFGFVQLPLYQRVNGVQLTADVGGIVGVSYIF